MELVTRRSAPRHSLERIRPGAYVPAGEWAAAAPRERHVAMVRAAGAAITERAVFSHRSAAAVHGIPIIGDWPAEVHASYDGANGMSPRAGLRWSRAKWEEGDVVSVGHLRVTSLRRTAIDLARTGSLVDAVVAMDHVLARGVELGKLLAWIGCQPTVRGIHTVRRAAGIARGLSESPLESLSLARFAEFGIPMPVQQHELVGGKRYRLDFFWPEFGVAGEADGRSKYLAPADLWREKRREDDIRRVVRTVVRWSWSDAWTVAPLRQLLANAGIPSV